VAKKPKGGAQETASTAAPHTSQPKKREGPGATRETAADVYLSQMANDPRFKEVKGATGFVFLGDDIHEQSKASARGGSGSSFGWASARSSFGRRTRLAQVSIRMPDSNR